MTQAPLDDTVIIFDLDGTLVDSAPDLAASLNVVLAEEDLPAVPLEAARPFVGHGARALLQQGFARGGAVFPEGASGDALVARFLDDYETHLARDSVLFPGCLACLDALAAQGAVLTVCTNKLARLAHPLLEALGVAETFALIYGRDSAAEHKPSGLPLRELMKRTDRARAVMVGDTETDRAAARNAGIPVALASFGYGLIDAPLGAKEQRFDGFEALPEVVTKLLF